MATSDEILAKLEEIKGIVANLNDDGTVPGKVVKVVNGLSEIDDSLGLVSAGEFRAGNREVPGQGFSGVRIVYPAMTYDGEDWHIVGVNNDTLQFGLRASDGAALAGGGEVRLTNEGLLIQTSSTANAVFWRDIANNDGINYGSIFAFESGSSPNRRGSVVISAGIEAGGSGEGSVELRSDGPSGAISTAKMSAEGSFGITYNTEKTNEVFGGVLITVDSNNTPADGLGTKFGFILENAAGVNQNAGYIVSKWDDAVNTKAQLSIYHPSITDQNELFRTIGALGDIIWNPGNRDRDYIVRGDTNDVLKVDAGLDVAILNSVKTDTGDHTGQSGMLVINEFDNNIKMYADGAWRTLATW